MIQEPQHLLSVCYVPGTIQSRLWESSYLLLTFLNTERFSNDPHFQLEKQGTEKQQNLDKTTHFAIFGSVMATWAAEGQA